MKDFLLPYTWKYPGLVFILMGLVLSILYIWYDFRFTLPVFAVFSSFVETKMFATFNTNFADELIMLLFVIGFSLVALSRENNESDKLDFIRAKALVKALISNTLLLVLSVLFVYGSGFIAILVLNLFSFLFFYVCIFYYLKKKDNSKIRE